MGKFQTTWRSIASNSSNNNNHKRNIKRCKNWDAGTKHTQTNIAQSTEREMGVVNLNIIFKSKYFICWMIIINKN